MVKKHLIPILAILLVSCSSFADKPAPASGTEMGEIDPDVKAQVEEIFDESGIPSMAVAIVVGDELAWAKGLGEQPDLSTIYMIGSINKAYIATAFMSQAEDGLIRPEDDINEYLPFEFRNPSAPDVPITLSMLMLHQSGLANEVPGMRYVSNDGPMCWWRFWNMDNKNFGDLWHAIIPFNQSGDEVVERAVTEGDPAIVWPHKPYAGLTYSNDAYYHILGRVIGETEGTTYQDVVTQRVVKPLGLQNTSFEAYDFPEEQLAIPYFRMESGYKRFPITGLSASGLLRSNVLDLARFMALHMSDGTLDGVQIISQESISQMHARGVDISSSDWIDMRLEGWGWGWQLWTNDLMGHTGAVPSFVNQMTYRDAEMPYGVVVLMNGGCSFTECDWDWLSDTFGAIRELLMEEAAKQAAEQ
jgi:CubicO group peptidase (beta-lactamase class C family)